MAVAELREVTGLKSIRPGDGLDMGAKETKVSRMALGFCKKDLCKESHVQF